jgi:iron complex outermembrane receptor protein
VAIFLSEGRFIFWCGPPAGNRNHSGPEGLTRGARRVLKHRYLGIAIAVLMTLPLRAQLQPRDLAAKSIEELMNIEVTSASKKEQKLSQVAAAIFVITQEEIRRSGALNIPDLLRMVPGLDVAQINASTWAISARGFNLQFANKLLVLIDGRAVYTPLFGGVYWDTVDVPLDDIERIEVIRGPGGTVWGANAVNGVINIITKNAEETQGGLVTGGGGVQAQGFGTVQYGGKINEDNKYRIFTKYASNDHFPDLNGQDGNDSWHLLHGGFRMDSALSSKDSLMTQGDIYTGSEGAIITHSVFFPPDNIDVNALARVSGGNVLTRWSHIFSSRFDTTLQFYFDRYDRDGPDLDESRDTFDVDFQNHIRLGVRQDLIWGAGYRHTADETIGTIDHAFIPANNASQLFNAFVQDQITLESDRVTLYVGSKFQNDYFAGFDVQPSIRLAWTPNNHRTFWAAVSRAIRTPTRRDVGLDAVLAALPGPAEVVLLGNPNMKPEDVIAYEIGYREQPNNRVSLDFTAFFNVYHSLESLEPSPSFFDSTSVPPLLVLPTLLDNRLYGTTQGVEASVSWHITHAWTLSPGYSFLKMNLHTDATSLDSTSVANTEGSNPDHQGQLLSHVELSRGISWDANAYFVGPLPIESVPSYTRLDTQVRWKLGERIELNLVGQNLLKDHHAEFNNVLQSINSSLIKRSTYAKLTWQF